jgi:hypothetical protein
LAVNSNRYLKTVALGLIILVIGIIGYTMYSIVYSPTSPGSLVQCPEYGCPANRGSLIMTGVSFPVGGPLTMTFYNQGFAGIFADAKYYVCNSVGARDCALATVIGGNCSANVSPGSKCEVTVTAPVLGPGSFGSVYTLLLATNVGTFSYQVTSGIVCERATLEATGKMTGLTRIRLGL